MGGKGGVKHKASIGARCLHRRSVIIANVGKLRCFVYAVFFVQSKTGTPLGTKVLLIVNRTF